MDDLFNLMSVTQAATYLGVTRQKMYELIDKERITPIRVAGYMTVAKSEVEKLKAEFEKEMPA